LPLLLPGAEERVTWNLIPIECGYINVPRVRVVDHRGISGTVDGATGEREGEGGGELVRVVDVRFEQSRGVGEEIGRVDVGTILVLP